MQEQAQIEDYQIAQLAIAKVFKQHTRPILSISFSDNGQFVVTADQYAIYLFQASTSKKLKSLYLKSKQIRLVRMTHSNNAVLCATRKNHQILYWSIHQNQIVKIFKGHTDQIQCLEMNPSDDTFLSTSRDHTFKLWNLQVSHYGAQAELNLSSKVVCSYPVACFDNKGIIFAVAFTQQIEGGSSCCRICLYDKGKFEQGAFTSWLKDYGQIKSLTFSKCGSYVLCGTSQNYIGMLDAFTGEQKFKLTNILNQDSPIQCFFSPDSRFIVSGSQNGIVHIWNIYGQKKQQLKAHQEKCTVVQFSPTHCLLVTGGRNLIWWLPRRK